MSAAQLEQDGAREEKKARSQTGLFTQMNSAFSPICFWCGSASCLVCVSLRVSTSKEGLAKGRGQKQNHKHHSGFQRKTPLYDLKDSIFCCYDMALVGSSTQKYLVRVRKSSLENRICIFVSRKEKKPSCISFNKGLIYCEHFTFTNASGFQSAAVMLLFLQVFVGMHASRNAFDRAPLFNGIFCKLCLRCGCVLPAGCMRSRA